MEYKDYYKIMGVAKDASEADIKKAYRKLARQYHPDVSKEKDAESKFKEVNEAYEVLKDPEKRQAYNQLGADWKSGAGASQAGGFGGFQQRQQAGAGDFSDFFEQFFGGQRAGARSSQATRPKAGEDLHTTVQIRLEEAYLGTHKTIQYEMPEVHGEREPKALTVKIPAGVITGQQMRLTGQGAIGVQGAKAGDLYLKIEVLEHPQYQVAGRDLTLTVAVMPWEAALGAVLTVPTLGGSVDVKIPSGTKSGSKMRLKGRGLPGKIPGDQYLLLQIQVPVPTTPEQIAYYEHMRELFTAKS